MENFKDRIILHSDLNNFYATCECLLHPEFNGRPLVVCGKVKDRHGIVLAKNYIAKSAGIKTGMTIYEARKLISNLVAVEANHTLYYEYSKLVKNIYLEYTDRVESFGIDEAWLDLTESQLLFDNAEKIAYEIKERIKNEIGLTVSIGVSFNKIFAKLGSDMKKPDAITVIGRGDFKEKVWSLPVENLLFVGRATQQKLNELGVFTIGDVASFDISFLKRKLGKWGEYLWNYANGYDCTPVKRFGEHDEIKSVGNSITFYRDLDNIQDVETLIFLLSESVASRMKSYDVGMARTVRLYVVDNNLQGLIRQGKLRNATDISSDIAKGAMDLFSYNFAWNSKVRGVGVSVTDFVKEEQLTFGFEQIKKDKNKIIDVTLENLRGRFGRNVINRGLVLFDERFSAIEINGANISGNNLDLKNLEDFEIFDYSNCLVQ